MPLTEDSIEIAASPEAIWEYLTDPDKGLLWQQSMIEMSNDDAELQKGSITRGVVKVAGRKLPWTAEVTEIDPYRRLAFKSVESPVSFAIENTLEDLGGRTRLHFRNDAGSFGSFFGKLADPLVVRMYAKSVRADLESLKELAEHEAE